MFILSDDQGAWATGYSGNNDIHTPTLDMLAQEGMCFNNFFCVSPVCSPARASILTGEIPSRHGVMDWLRAAEKIKDESFYLKGHTLYTDILKSSGYTCGLSGKWHLGNSMEQHESFDHFYAHTKGSSNYYNAPMVKNGKIVKDSAYITDLITDDAIAFIKKANMEGKPFYSSVHYTAPHNPWTKDNHPEKYIDMYENCLFDSCPKEGIRDDAIYRYQPDVAHHAAIGYFAAISAMDNNISRIVSTLKSLDILENTLIVFTSDNGFNCGHHGIWGKGNGNYHLNMYDTSVKVPMLMYHKGTIMPNGVSEHLLSHYDLFDTLLEYVGVNHSAASTRPGKSFCNILYGNTYEEEGKIVIYNEYGPVRMIRSHTRKYVHRYFEGGCEFYDLVKDPNECINQIANEEYSAEIDAMKQAMIDWFEKYRAETIDGAREPVTGAGQYCFAVDYSKGIISFEQERSIMTKITDDPGNTSTS